MADTKPRDLEIDEDLRLERRFWVAERVGWALMAVVAVAAAVGLFGRGLMGTASAEAGAVRVEYYRFWRASSAMPLTVHLSPPAEEQGEARLWISRSYLEHMTLEAVTPEPESVEAGTERMTFVFSLEPLEGPTSVSFSLRRQRSGPVRGEVGLEGAEAVRFSQFFFP